MKTPSLKSLVLLSILSVHSLSQAAGLPPFDGNQALPTLAPMLEHSMPAVVNISTSKNIQVSDNPLMQDPVFRQFFNVPNQLRQQQQKNSLGSGVIIDSKQGLVLTNNHVIDKADTIMVTLHDGRQLNAELIGTDPESDVAVIKIPANNLSQLTMADSSLLKVGDFVVAIGNPFGVGETVTSGIVSAMGRDRVGINTFENFIQTDAAINPGNSGGALIDTHGNLIGINTAIFSNNGGSMGIGFAIPINLVKQIMEAIIKNGSVTRGWIGVEPQNTSPELLESLGLGKDTGGVVLSGVLEQGPADRGGIKPGDVLLSVNNQNINDVRSLLNLIAQEKPGDEVELKIIRKGKPLEIKIRIGKRPSPK